VLTLLELLQSGGTRTAAELADRLSVDARTVRRYVGHLADLDVPVEAVRGRYGGYRLAPGYRMPPLMLDDDEALAVLLGLVAGRRTGLMTATGTAGETAAAKIRRVLPARLGGRLDAVLDALAFTAPGAADGGAMDGGSAGGGAMDGEAADGEATASAAEASADSAPASASPARTASATGAALTPAPPTGAPAVTGSPPPTPARTPAAVPAPPASAASTAVPGGSAARTRAPGDPAAAPRAAVLLAVADAVRHHRPVSIRYTAADGRRSARTIHPFGLVAHAGRWYLTGLDPAIGEERTFRLDRVADARTLPGSFAPPAGPAPAERVLTALATAPYRYEVTLRVQGTADLLRRRLPAGLAIVTEPSPPSDSAGDSARGAARDTAGDTARGTAGEAGVDDGDDIGRWSRVELRVERLDWLPSVLASLDLPFAVERPAELRTLVAELANRLAQSASRVPRHR
jgi:predicted DNA-binding transcriptional regulator YafY